MQMQRTWFTSCSKNYYASSSVMYDLCLTSKSSKEKERQALLTRLIGFGWQCVAWNVNAIGKVNPAQTKPLKPVVLESSQLNEAYKYRSFLINSSDAIPSMSFASASNSNSNSNSNSAVAVKTVTSSGTATDNAIRQFSRVTVIVDDVQDAQALSAGSEALRQFDLVAVRPGNSKVFAYLCKQAEVDIIDLTQVSADINFSKKLLDEAVSRGIHFEINYGGMISSPSSRRELLSKTKLLVQYLRGRNIVITSAAETFNQVRGPHDVVNIAKILQLNNENAIKTIKENCVKVIQHAYSRKLRNLPVEVFSGGEFKEKFPELTTVLKSSRDLWVDSLDASAAKEAKPLSVMQQADGPRIPSGNNMAVSNHCNGDNSDNSESNSDSSGDDDDDDDDENHDGKEIDGGEVDESAILPSNLGSYRDDDEADLESEQSEAFGVLKFPSSSKSKSVKEVDVDDDDKKKNNVRVNDTDSDHDDKSVASSSMSSHSSSDNMNEDFVTFSEKSVKDSKAFTANINNDSSNKRMYPGGDSKGNNHDHNKNYNHSGGSSDTNIKFDASKKLKSSDSFSVSNSYSKKPNNNHNNTSPQSSLASLSATLSKSQSSSQPTSSSSSSLLPNSSKKLAHAPLANTKSGGGNGNRLLSLMKGKK